VVRHSRRRLWNGLWWWVIFWFVLAYSVRDMVIMAVNAGANVISATSLTFENGIFVSSSFSLVTDLVRGC